MNIDRALTIVSIVLGIIVSWYFYEKSIAVKRLHYKTEVFTDVIANPGPADSSQIRVFTSAGDPIDAPVYSGRHTIWNDGNAPIVPADVLEPLIVNFESTGSSAIAAHVVRQSRHEVDCRIVKLGSNALQISFKLLEPGDGCEFQVVYSGDRYPKLRPSATVVGAGSISLHSAGIDEVAKKTKLDVLASISPILFLLTTTALFCFLYSLASRWSIPKTAYTVVATTLLSSQIAFLLNQYAESRAYSKFGPEIPGYSSWKPAGASGGSGAGRGSSGKPELTNQGNYSGIFIPPSGASQPPASATRQTPSYPNASQRLNPGEVGSGAAEVGNRVEIAPPNPSRASSAP